MRADSDIIIYKQIFPKHCAKLAQMGFCSIINIRPDGECESQPSSQELALAAHQAQLNYVYVPFDCERLSPQTIAAFAQQYHQLPKPILLFCGTGGRAKLLYQSALMQGLL